MDALSSWLVAASRSFTRYHAGLGVAPDMKLRIANRLSTPCLQVPTGQGTPGATPAGLGGGCPESPTPQPAPRPAEAPDRRRGGGLVRRPQAGDHGHREAALPGLRVGGEALGPGASGPPPPGRGGARFGVVAGTSFPAASSCSPPAYPSQLPCPSSLCPRKSCCVGVAGML